ncbi:VOC family protein [Nocardia grenadensis]|uniref:VOC family protein n=1 Tax=Nocardia grenadensis TaxID=931537 RepID=UPI0007A3D89F|nr:VOC family protein [Nocardia grenadensis]
MIAFDHVTAFVEDRHQTARHLRKRGFHAVEGGRHQGFGSANDLCYFDLFYLELLEILDKREATVSGSEVCRYAVEFLASGEGLATLALETDDLDGITHRLRERGFDVADPIDMQRVHDNGFVSRSRIIYPRSGQLPIRPPIVIERSSPPAERRRTLTDGGVIGQHRLGAIDIEFVGVAVADALSAAQALGQAYGVPADSEAHVDRRIDAQCADVHFDRARLRFCQPISDAGAAAIRLRSRGPGPFSIGARVSDEVRRELNADADGHVDAAVTGFDWYLS